MTSMSKATVQLRLAAGGTGGHMFPAEALAQELKAARPQNRVLLVTDARGARYAKNFPPMKRFLISAASPSVGGVIAKAARRISIAAGLFKAVQELQRVSQRRRGGWLWRLSVFCRHEGGVFDENSLWGSRTKRRAGPREPAIGRTTLRFTAHAFSVLEKVPEKARDDGI